MAYVAVYANLLRGQRDMDALFRDHGPEIRQAVNEAGRLGYSYAQKVITRDLNFPAGYLTSGRRLTFREARTSTDSAIISARKRPTSLAQFVQGHPGFGQRGGVAVKVLRGRHRHLDKAFLMRVKAGKSSLNNVGVFMREEAYNRLPNRWKGSNSPGERPTRIRASKHVWDGIVGLYGPSVDQAFSTHLDDIWLEAGWDMKDRIGKILTGEG